jgi:ubiquinone/menaquinone biosynthesis C-methylase UbiE
MQSTHSFPLADVDNRSIYELTWNTHAGAVLELGLEMGLFEFLAAGPQSIEAVAAEFSLSLFGAEAMLAVSAAAGMLAASAGGEMFGLNENGRTFLLKESPFYYEGFFPRRWSFMDELRAAVSAKQPPPDPLAVNMKEASVEDVRGFINRMHILTLPVAGGLARLPVFSGIERLLDVAGGSGSLSCAIAAENPNIHCTVLDLPAVCTIARENIDRYGLSDQVDTLPGDMFQEPLPTDYDAILFGNIFHNWEADTCQLLARKAYEALPPGGNILLHEMLLNENKDGPLTIACFSVSMLLHEKGKQYTLTELKGFLEEAGFGAVSAVPAAGYYSLVTAQK